VLVPDLVRLLVPVEWELRLGFRKVPGIHDSVDAVDAATAHVKLAVGHLAVVVGMLAGAFPQAGACGRLVNVPRHRFVRVQRSVLQPAPTVDSKRGIAALAIHNGQQRLVPSIQGSSDTCRNLFVHGCRFHAMVVHISPCPWLGVARDGCRENARRRNGKELHEE